MSVLVQADLAGLANGSAWSPSNTGTGDTAMSTMNGGAATIRTGDTYSPCVEFAQTSGVVDDAEFIWAAPVTQIAGRFYFKTPAAWLASSATILAIWTGASNCHKIAIAGSGSPGQVRVSNTANTNIISTPTNVLSLNTWYRFEWLADGAGTVRLVIYTGDSTSSIYDSGSTAGTFGTTYDRVFWGNFSASPTIDFRMAHLKIQSGTALVGPFSTGGPPPPAAYNVSNGIGTALTVLRGDGAALILPH